MTMSPDEAYREPVKAGLAEVVTTGAPEVTVLACTLCGVLLWDSLKHWNDAHPVKLQAKLAVAGGT